MTDPHRRNLEHARDLLRGAEEALLAADGDATARRALAHTGKGHGQSGVQWIGRTAALLADAARSLEAELGTSPQRG